MASQNSSLWLSGSSNQLFSIFFATRVLSLTCHFLYEVYILVFESSSNFVLVSLCSLRSPLPSLSKWTSFRLHDGHSSFTSLPSIHFWFSFLHCIPSTSNFWIYAAKRVCSIAQFALLFYCWFVQIFLSFPMMIHIQVVEALNTSCITEYASLLHLVSAGVKAERAAKQSKSAETALVRCISAKWHLPSFQILQRNI